MDHIGQLMLVMSVSTVVYFFVAKALAVEEISITSELIKIQFARATAKIRKSTPKVGE